MLFQIQMYQLSRLLHDYHRDLHCHLEQQDIAPSLYAPPWFLTTFASQYPLGFVARVFGEFAGNGRSSRNVFKCFNQDTDDRRRRILLFDLSCKYGHTRRFVFLMWSDFKPSKGWTVECVRACLCVCVHHHRTVNLWCSPACQAPELHSHLLIYRMISCNPT